MATSYVNIKAKVKWAKLYEPDSYAGQDNYKINLYPVDDAEWEKFEKTGLGLKVKDDIDGRYFTVRRPTKKLIKDDLVIFAPPEITGKVNVKYVDENGNRVRQYNKGDKVTVTREGEPIAIGNESLVLANLSYYDTSKGKGHRLESINVLELVDFVPTAAPDEVEVKAEEPVKIEAKKKDLKEELSDELPW